MVLYAAQIQQQLYMSQLLMAQQAQGAQMLSAQMGLAPMPPMMPQMGLVGAASNVGTSGLYGEQVANRLVGAGRMAMGMGGLAAGVAGGFAGIPLDPFSAAWTFGRAGYASMGIGGAALGAVGGALPFLGLSQVAGAYTNAFTGGMREQAGYNSMLRQNFNFLGGQGSLGRGFSQNQMGQIGNMLSAETMRTPFTSSQELNQLIQQGSEAGLFRAVRDVESFSQRFRTMLDGLRKIQKELGGTLSEAMAFTRGAQQVGIFSQGARTAFAGEVRDAMSTTGMDQNQIFALAATGSMLSRMTGGLARQGAVGAVRTARSLGSALSMGAITDEALSEATGGLTGQDAIQAFSARILQMSERFSHRAAGRYSLFAMANESGTGMDAAMLDRFRAGDISVGGVMRDAQRRVNRLGRARALNQEGRLRGALLEEGGLAGQIGIMRLHMGDRVLDQGDDLAQLVMQRRYGMSQAESQVITSLMRNQGAIAQNENVERGLGRRQVAEQQDIATNRSLSAFMTNLEHGMQDATGILAARRAGRDFLTRVSTLAQRTLDSFLGIQGEALSTSEQRAAMRLVMGQATAQDLRRLDFGGVGPGTARDASYRSGSQAVLHGLGFHGPRSLQDVMQERGINIRGLSPEVQDRLVRQMDAANQGILTDPREAAALTGLMGGDQNAAKLRMSNALLRGGRGELYRQYGEMSPNVVDAFAHLSRFDLGPIDYTSPRMGMGGGSWWSKASSALVEGANGFMVGAGGGAIAGSALGPWGMALGGLGFGAVTGITTGMAEWNRQFMTDPERAVEFLSRGGHLGQETRNTRFYPGENGRLTDQGLLVESMRSALQDAPSKEDIQAVLGSDTFRTSLQRLRGLRGEEQRAELASLSTEISGMSPEMQRAGRFLLAQLQYNTGQWNGRVGAEWGEAMSDPAKRAAAQRFFRQTTKAFGGMISAAGPNNPFTESLEGMMQGLYSGDITALHNYGERIVGDIAAIDPKADPAAYRQAVDTFSGTEEGRAFLMGGGQMRQGIRELMGKGRRGQAGAADASLGMLTGFGLSGMDFTVKRGGKDVTLRKQNQARVIYDILRRGGKGSEDLQLQLADQLKASGVKDADSLVHEFAGAVHGGLTETEATEMYKKLSGNEDLKRIQQEGLQKALAAAGQSDPLGKERNDLLRDIKTAVYKTANLDKDGMEVNQSGP